MIAMDASRQASHESVAWPPSVAALAECRLRTSSYPSHRKLRCSFRGGVLTLEGRVSSYFLRQMACALLTDLQGVEEFVDRIEVIEAARTRRGFLS